MAIWIILILLILFFAGTVAVLQFHVLQLFKRANVIEEAFWMRRHKIPLFISVAERSVGRDPSLFDRIIDTRDKVSGKAYTLYEQVSLERILSDLLSEVVKTGETNSDLKSDALFLSMKKELVLVADAIETAKDSYNSYLKKWNKFYKYPVIGLCVFFTSFGQFQYKIGKNEVL